MKIKMKLDIKNFMILFKKKLITYFIYLSISTYAYNIDC